MTKKNINMQPCTQEQQIQNLLDNTDKLSKIITGNGDPEKGLMRIVAVNGERQKYIIEKLETIHESINDYRKEVDEAKNISSTTQHAFEQYKAELSGEDKGVNKRNLEQQVTFNRNISIISTIVLVITVLVSIWLGGNKQDKIGSDISEKVDNLGAPVIVNERNQIVPLPKGDSIRYFRDGEYKNTMRDEKTK